MKHLRTYFVSVLAIIVIVWVSLLAAPTAFADTSGSILSTKPVSVHRGEVIEDVVVVGNNVEVSGDVYEALLVLNGNVHLKSTARVGVLVDFGGTIQKDPGAHVNAEYAVSSRFPFWNRVLLGSGMVLIVWAVRVVLSVALLLIPVLLAFVLRKWIEPSVNIITESVRRSGLAGFLASVGILVVSGALAVTIIGIPISAVIFGCYAVVGVVGWSAVCLWLGKIIAQAFNQGGRAQWLQTAMGATVLMAFINTPIVGPIFLLLLWMVGVGAITIWSWQWYQKRRGYKPRTQ